jgi:hypothetical protein
MGLKVRLVDDWHWVVNHSWTVRLLMLAFVLSGAETVMPYFADYSPHPALYAVTMGLITGAAFVARLIAQNRVAKDK